MMIEQDLYTIPRGGGIFPTGPLEFGGPLVKRPKHDLFFCQRNFFCYDTHECDYDTYECILMTQEYDFHTLSAFK
jgi:hypothetical protein